MKRMLRRSFLNSALLLGVASSLVVSAAGPASADTATATANAIHTGNLSALLGGALGLTGINLLGGSGSLIDTGTCTATASNSTPAATTGNCTPANSLLNGENVVTAGVLTQDARASAAGTSSACAGLLASGGSISIGTNPPCTTNTPGSGGLTLLGGAVAAEAIVARCAATSTGAPTGSADVIGLQAGTLLSPLLGLSPVSLPNNGVGVPANTNINLLGTLLSLTLNKQTVSNGHISVTALELVVLGITIDIGNVTCGPNAVEAAVPSLPLRGLPYGAATVGIVGAGALLVRRRRSAAASRAA